MESDTEMTAAALVDLLQFVENGGLSVWLDGGWGVDALLEKQTRPHRDVDIILPVADVPELRAMLARRGYAVKQGSPPNSFVLADRSGLEVDVHAFVFDDAGNGVYLMENGESWVYPAEGFSGRGAVGGMRVRCLSARTQVLCHAQGYEPIDKDRRDMEHLRERFGVELPPHLRLDSI